MTTLVAIIRFLVRAVDRELARSARPQHWL
jgi:hypothetical protein